MPEQTIKDVRKQLGITQQQMAERLGISRQRYAAVEADPSKATIAQAKAICAVLGEHYQHIFFGKFVS